MRTARFLCLFALPLILSLTLMPVTNSQQPAATPAAEEPPIPIFPTGSLASFLAAAKQPTLKKIFIRRDAPEDTRVWVAGSQEVLLPAADVTDPQKPISTENGVGFMIPQLPLGAYVAWYDADTANPTGQSMKLRILPELRADTGIVRGSPGEEVNIAVRIYSPTVTRKDAKTADEVTVNVTLTPQIPQVADLAPAQSAVVSTNREGYSAWKVHIKTPGITGFIARAEGFQPVQVAVVGMRRPARTFMEGETLAAEESRLEYLRAMQAATQKLNEKKRQEARTEQEMAKAGDPQRPTDPEAVSRVKRNTAAAEAEMLRAESAAANAQQALTQLNAQRTSEPRILTEDDLLPGDIFLVLGGSFASRYIVAAETKAANQPSLYSHASLYLGKSNGRGMVAEMWDSGYWITPIDVSTKGLIIVDVYRRDGIDDAKRSDIVARAQGLYGTRPVFLSLFTPLNGSLIPYAMEQITVLGSAARNVPALGLRIAAAGTDVLAGGKKKMICSELVAWVYHDAGLELNVEHWKSLVDANVLTTEARRMDYTTPNMIARSHSIHLVGRYLAP